MYSYESLLSREGWGQKVDLLPRRVLQSAPPLTVPEPVRFHGCCPNHQNRVLLSLNVCVSFVVVCNFKGQVIAIYLNDKAFEVSFSALLPIFVNTLKCGLTSLWGLLSPSY